MVKEAQTHDITPHIQERRWLEDFEHRDVCSKFKLSHQGDKRHDDSNWGGVVVLA